MIRVRLGRCVIWWLTLGLAGAAAAQDDPAAREQAAREEVRRGDLYAAATDFAEAARLYTDASDAEGRLRTRVRLGEVERDLGRPRLAVQTLSEAVSLARVVSRPEFEAAARGALAGALVGAGDPVGAQREARTADALAASLGDSALRAAVIQELGNVLADTGDLPGAAHEYARAAGMASAAGDPSLVFRARTNAAALAVEAKEPGAASFVTAARTSGEDLAPSHAHAYAWIRLGRSAQKIDDPLARSDLDRALAMAQSLGDPGAASWALGSIAARLQWEGRPAEALPLAREALRDARRARLPDAELQWLALVGRLERDRGEREAALRDFLAASELMAERRAATRGSERLHDASRISDVYLDLVDLLLARAHESKDPDLSARDLRAAQQALERFKADELRDYFRDDCVDAYREKVRDAASASPTAAVIYPVSLPDRLEILVSSRSGIRQFRAEVSQTELESEVASFRRELTIRTSRRYLRPARRLYDWIIAPIQAHLDELGVDTLVFVPGGVLRTVPMAALHDGERFLIERYAVATTPGLELTDPRPIDRSDLDAFLGGLSEPVKGFAALPHVGAELESVKGILGGGDVLLNEGFTVSGVEQSLETNPFRIVHIATHGEFGATADDFFLVTHDGRLTLDELATAVGAFRFREEPLELIFLSACDTASGDPRAALGLAGVAVKSGARSAVGSLWKVNDEAAAQLVEGFYRALREPGVSRAESLRRAQLGLLADPRFRHPAYWSPFLLISNWL